MFSNTNAQSIQAILHASVANYDSDSFSTVLQGYLESLEQSIVASINHSNQVDGSE